MTRKFSVPIPKGCFPALSGESITLGHIAGGDLWQLQRARG